MKATTTTTTSRRTPPPRPSRTAPTSTAPSHAIPNTNNERPTHRLHLHHLRPSRRRCTTTHHHPRHHRCLPPPPPHRRLSLDLTFLLLLALVIFPLLSSLLPSLRESSLAPTTFTTTSHSTHTYLHTTSFSFITPAHALSASEAMSRVADANNGVLNMLKKTDGVTQFGIGGYISLIVLVTSLLTVYLTRRRCPGKRAYLTDDDGEYDDRGERGGGRRGRGRERRPSRVSHARSVREVDARERSRSDRDVRREREFGRARSEREFERARSERDVERVRPFDDHDVDLERGSARGSDRDRGRGEREFQRARTLRDLEGDELDRLERGSGGGSRRGGPGGNGGGGDGDGPGSARGSARGRARSYDRDDREDRDERTNRSSSTPPTPRRTDTTVTTERLVLEEDPHVPASTTEPDTVRGSTSMSPERVTTLRGSTSLSPERSIVPPLPLPSRVQTSSGSNSKRSPRVPPLPPRGSATPRSIIISVSPRGTSGRRGY